MGPGRTAAPALPPGREEDRGRGSVLIWGADQENESMLEPLEIASST